MTEGVIIYCYVFLKQVNWISKLGQTEKMCNSILDLYRIPEGGERKCHIGVCVTRKNFKI